MAFISNIEYGNNIVMAAMKLLLFNVTVKHAELNTCFDVHDTGGQNAIAQAMLGNICFL